MGEQLWRIRFHWFTFFSFCLS